MQSSAKFPKKKINKKIGKESPAPLLKLTISGRGFPVLKIIENFLLHFFWGGLIWCGNQPEPNHETKMNLPNKKQFISNAKRAASNYRRQRRKLERQNDENENGAHPDDLEEYKLDAYEFLGVLKATFDIMEWGEIPKMLTRNLEPNFY